MTSGMTNIASLTGTLDPNLPVTELVLPNGQTVRIETLLLLGAEATEPTSQGLDATATGETAVIPLIEERLVIGKRTVETGKVRLIKTVSSFEEQLHEPLALRTFDIERKLFNEPVETAPPVRQQGATTVYSVVEEQLVLTKQLVLKEEIHVTMRDGERIDTQVVTLHREHLTVEREDVAAAAAQPSGS